MPQAATRLSRGPPGGVLLPERGTRIGEQHRVDDERLERDRPRLADASAPAFCAGAPLIAFPPSPGLRELAAEGAPDDLEQLSFAPHRRAPQQPKNLTLPQAPPGSAARYDPDNSPGGADVVALLEPVQTVLPAPVCSRCTRPAVYRCGVVRSVPFERLWSA